MNLRKLMYKLQTALTRRGRYIRIEQRQFYAEEAGRMLTKYVIVEGKKTLLETFRPADVVKLLADELKETG